MARHRDRHRLIRWLWSSRRLDARLARLALLPVAAVWRAGMTARAVAYQRGWLAARELPLPSVSIGNLTVGGTGKTPVAIWVAQYYARQALVPGILLRGYGGDEVLVHRQAVPEARVVADPDRLAGARRAFAEGAQVLVLDDAYQRLDVRRDYNIAVVSADHTDVAGWPLPAGPWREGWSALRRADAAIVTRKQVSAPAALAVAEQVRRRVTGPVAIAHLGVATLDGLVSGQSYASALLRDKRVIAASAIGDPAAFAAQLEALGARVEAATWRDHHVYDDDDISWLAAAAERADYVVVTRKDAVKLQNRWPAAALEPLVARLELEWEQGGERIAAALADVIHARMRNQPESL